MYKRLEAAHEGEPALLLGRERPDFEDVVGADPHAVGLGLAAPRSIRGVKRPGSSAQREASGGLMRDLLRCARASVAGAPASGQRARAGVRSTFDLLSPA
jgi:hypothetical protein